MTNLLTIFWVLAVGLTLGILFFGGLWFTVKKALTSKKPALWFVGSLILRLGITLLGFYYITMEDWRRLLLCLFGFLIARFMVMRYTKHKDETQIENKKLV